jgi:hypothetical protein
MDVCTILQWLLRSLRAGGLVTLGVPQNRRWKVVTLCMSCFISSSFNWSSYYETKFQMPNCNSPSVIAMKLLLPHVISTLVDRLLHRSLQLSLTAHSCISSTVLQSHLLLSTSLLTWSIHCECGMCLGLLPHIISVIFLVFCAHPFFNMSKPSPSTFLDLVLYLYFLHLELSANICVSNSVHPSFSYYCPQEFHLNCL